MAFVGERAVVLGASMGGLLAARALAESYEHVTVVDRDELPAGRGHRRGVPQGRHAHALQPRGGQALDELFPGLIDEVVAAGAPEGDLLGNVRWLLSGHRIRRDDIGVRALFASRPLLEEHVRARVRGLPTVRFAGGHDIVGLAATSDHRAVTGVRVSRPDTGETVIPADLVVDATGRGSRTPLWLERLGYERPAVDRVQIDVAYSSRNYRLAPGALGDDKLILVNWTPEHPRSACVVAQEGGRYLVTAAGMLGDAPPTDPNGFLEFTASLPFGDIYRAIRNGRPIDDPVAFRYPANVRHRYERLSRFPDGLLLLGDAVCGFNPIYGQGMTVAALEAATLRRLLTRGRTPSWRRYFAAIAKVIDVPWDLATGADLAFPGVTGQRTAKIRLVNAYVSRLHAAAATDTTLSEAFVRVTGLLDRPESLLRPDHIIRVLRATRRNQPAQTDEPTASQPPLADAA